MINLLRPRQNSRAELQAFDDTCERLAGFDDRVSFEWVDGLLCALAAGPRLPEPAVWLTAMFGDTFERVFADPQDHAQAWHALQVRLKVLCDQLDPGALLDDPDMLRLDPLLIDLEGDQRQRLADETGIGPDAAAALQIGGEWAAGFLAGVQALPEIWNDLPHAEAAEVFAQALAHIAALLFPAGSEALQKHVQTYYPKEAPTRDDLLGEACMAVQDIRLYWVDFAPKTETRRVDTTPGRNDPCHCGSGKKFKKCHGA